MLFAWFVVWGPLWLVVASIVASLIWQVVVTLLNQQQKTTVEDVVNRGGGQTRVCPRCAETIKAAANVCRFCRRDFSVEDPSRFMLPTPRPKIKPDDAFDAMLDEIEAKPKRFR